MVRLVKDESLTASWQGFFEDQCKAEIETLATEYPEKRSLLLDYWVLLFTFASIGQT